MHAGEQWRQFTKRQVFLAPVAVFAVFGTSAYFVQTINIARPKMAADLDGMSLYSWSVSIPSLVPEVSFEHEVQEKENVKAVASSAGADD